MKSYDAVDLWFGLPSVERKGKQSVATQVKSRLQVKGDKNKTIESRLFLIPNTDLKRSVFRRTEGSAELNFNTGFVA